MKTPRIVMKKGNEQVYKSDLLLDLTDVENPNLKAFVDNQYKEVNGAASVSITKTDPTTGQPVEVTGLANVLNELIDSSGKGVTVIEFSKPLSYSDTLETLAEKGITADMVKRIYDGEFVVFVQPSSSIYVYKGKALLYVEQVEYSPSTNDWCLILRLKPYGESSPSGDRRYIINTTAEYLVREVDTDVPGSFSAGFEIDSSTTVAELESRGITNAFIIDVRSGVYSSIIFAVPGEDAAWEKHIYVPSWTNYGAVVLTRQYYSSSDDAIVTVVKKIDLNSEHPVTEYIAKAVQDAQ